MLVSLGGTQTWRPEIGQNICSSLLPEKRFVFPCEFSNVKINISPET